MRPLEDAGVAPRDRLEAYFELLDVICEARWEARTDAEARDTHDDERHRVSALDLLTYTRTLLARLMRQGAADSPPDLPERVDAVMASGLAVTANTPDGAPDDPLLSLRLKAARQFALQAL